MKSLYITEDQEIHRKLLSAFFKVSFPEIKLRGMSSNGRSGVEACIQEPPDLVIADLHLPDMDGIAIVTRLKEAIPATKVLIFTGDTSGDEVQEILRAGADGLINKASGIDEFKCAIDALRDNQKYFSSEVLGGMEPVDRNTIYFASKRSRAALAPDPYAMIEPKGIGRQAGPTTKEKVIHPTGAFPLNIGTLGGR